MRKPLFALAFLMFALPVQAQTTKPVDMPAGIYTVEPSHASINFKVNHLGLSNYTARFTKFDATIDYDPKNVEKSKVTVSIDPTSIKTDYPFTDKEDFDGKISKDAAWLNAEKFPDMKFVSTSIKKTGPTTAKIIGDFTMLGVTKPLVLDAKFNGAYAEHPMTKLAMMGFSATTVIKRSDWGFNVGVPYVGDDVTVMIETEFMKAK